ncbi:MAG: AraC family transcriptional regulator ligand-binding domain-containing protein [Desulfatibacillum sp.]|nr:AraC family transcriptional regulator ligand-binding domain-containing protein [Desulfatibacillum sp.]
MNPLHEIRRPIPCVYPILRFAIDKGIGSASLLEGTGLEEKDLLDPRKDISLDQELSIIRNLITLAPEPEIAWELGGYFNARAHGALGSLVATAPTIGQIIYSIIEYITISNSYFRLHSESKGKVLRVFLMENHIPGDLLPFLVERDLVAGKTTIDNQLPGKIDEIVLGVSFGYAPRTDMEKYRKVFVKNVAFNQPMTVIDVDQSALSMPINQGNPREFELFRQQCQAEMALRSKEFLFLSDRIRLCLQAENGRIGLEQVASQLSMSERSLRRHLKKEGISFRAIRNQYFFQQSLNLLRNPKLQIEEIADMLGYSEPSAFSRAFQKWAGIPPGEYRKTVL